MTAIAPLTTCAAWKALEAHYLNIRDVHLRTLFAEDAARGERMAAEAVGLYFDYSKHRITDETLTLLLHLADESGLGARIEAMFRGDKINVTEKRTILHVALRVPKGHSIIVDGKDVVPPVHALLEKMTTFSNRVGSGEWTGYAGKPIHKAINIGIGGSELGPVMAYVKVETHSEEHVFEVQVYLDDLDPEAVRVELYSDGVNGDSPFRLEISGVRQLAGPVGGHVYRAAVSATLPSTDYTARVIPHFTGLAVPLEENHFLWQR